MKTATPPPAAPHAGAESHVLIKARNLSVTVDGHTVLDDVTMDLERRQIVSLIGPNGSGKTTLVRALLGLQPASGTLWRDPALKIGYVPQSVQFDHTLPMTVRRFLALVGRRSRHDDEAILEEVGADDLLEQAMQSLSGGESRRVMLAAALLGDPDLLVLDEATAGMDVTGQTAFYARLREIRDARDCGILLVSHDLHLVMAATDFVLCLNNHVCCSGRPDAVSRDPAYLNLFGPDAAAQLAVFHHDLAHHHHHHSDSHDGPVHADHHHG